MPRRACHRSSSAGSGRGALRFGGGLRLPCQGAQPCGDALQKRGLPIQSRLQGGEFRPSGRKRLLHGVRPAAHGRLCGRGWTDGLRPGLNRLRRRTAAAAPPVKTVCHGISPFRALRRHGIFSGLRCRPGCAVGLCLRPALFLPAGKGCG